MKKALPAALILGVSLMAAQAPFAAEKGARPAPEAHQLPAHYWVPNFVMATLQPPQKKLRAKLGGLPWGFPVEKWPKCKECGHALSLVAQLPHVPEILDLGSPGAVLHVFHCEDDPGLCDYWDYTSGANTCIVLDKSELKEGLTKSPQKKTRQFGESWITRWERNETPTLFLERIGSWYDNDLYFKMPENVIFHPDRDINKAGGLPCWTGNGPNSFPPEPYVFLAQFDTFIHFKGELPAPDEAGTTIRFNDANEDGTHRYIESDVEKENAMGLVQKDKGKPGYYGDWANLGSDGTGYLFINRTVTPAKVQWFWNR